MSISHTDKNDVATIAHEYGHAVDPVQDSYENANRRNPNIPRSIGARSDEYYNLVNREMNGSENGRRMLRDGYGQPDVIARRTYDGVPSYTSYAYENLRDSMSAGYPLRDSKRGFWQDAYGAYGNKPFIKSFPEHTPENNSIMYEFADYLGRTPEAIARKFTEGISSPDPIKRHLLVREALNNARYVDMSKFVNDATAHAAFMPKLPAATPSGTPSTGWQPVRNNSVYLDKK